MTIYIDSDFCCHIVNDNNMRAIETDFFDGKCATFIEGYRYIPSGESWTRQDGIVFHGKMVAPIADYEPIAKAQKQYELDDVKKWNSLSIPREDSFIAKEDHLVGSFVAVNGDIYEVTYTIPMWTKIKPYNNAIPITMEEYLNKIKEV